MIRVLNIFKNIEVGYNEEEELKARCETFKRKYLYDIQVNKNEDINFMIISICFLQELVNGLGIKKPILKSLERFNRSNEYHESILDSLVECNSFKEGFSLNYFMNKEVLSKKEYNKIGKKIISMRKKKTAI